MNLEYSPTRVNRPFNQHSNSDGCSTCSCNFIMSHFKLTKLISIRIARWLHFMGPGGGGLHGELLNRNRIKTAHVPHGMQLPSPVFQPTFFTCPNHPPKHPPRVLAPLTYCRDRIEVVCCRRRATHNTANFLPSDEYLQISCSKRDIENVVAPLAIGVACEISGFGLCLPRNAGENFGSMQLN